MAITFVGVTSGSAINGNNVTLTLPAARIAGDYAIVCVDLGTSKAAILAVTTSAAAAYTQIVATIGSSFSRFGVFRRILPSSGETTAVISGTLGTTDATAAVCHIFRGVSSGTPEDVAATSTTGASANPNSPSITVATPYCTIVSAIGAQWVAISSAPTSYFNSTSILGNDTWDAVAGQVWTTNNSSAPFDPAAWTSTGSASWCSATIALRPAVPSLFTWAGFYQDPDFKKYDLVEY